MDEKKTYIVTFEVFYPMDDELLELIPKQQEAIKKLFLKGAFQSYSLNKEKDKLWAIVQVDSEIELIQIIDSLPMAGFMSYEYDELIMHNSAFMLPSISMN